MSEHEDRHAIYLDLAWLYLVEKLLSKKKCREKERRIVRVKILPNRNGGYLHFVHQVWTEYQLLYLSKYLKCFLSYDANKK